MNAVQTSSFELDPPEARSKGDKAGTSSKIRVGVLVRSRSAPNWVVQLLRQVEGSDFAELALIVVDRRNHREGTGWESLLFRLWSRLDRQLNAHDEDAFASRELNSLAKEVRTVEIESAEAGAMMECVRSADLDVLIAFDGLPEGDEVFQCAKYGVWCAPEGRECGDLAATNFWAAYQREAVVGTALQAITHSHGAQIIYRSYSATNEVSPYLGKEESSWKTGQIILRRIEDLKRYGWDYVRTRDGNRIELASAQVNELPGNLAASRFVARWLADAARYQFNNNLRREQWFIAYRDNRGAVPMSEGDMSGFRVITPPRDRFYADPLVVRWNGRHYIFFEDYRYKLRRGLISCMEIDKQGQCGEPEVVLDLPYHLSYPSVFEHEGEYFLIPETWANRTVELYRALEFPRKWKLEKVLLKSVPAVDPTILKHEGRTWMFVSGMVEKGSTNDELFLYSADSLFGEWAPHPRNPVVSDVRTARPAGQIFRHDGNLIRPSQDCSTRYGFAVSLNRIDTLSTADYAEVPIGRISAGWHVGNLGTHTFNQNDRFQAVDGRVLIFK